MAKPRGKCITCGEPIGLASFFVTMHKGRARCEHSDCRRRKEGATAERTDIIAWLDRGIAYQAKTADNEWDRAKLEATQDIRADLVSGAWRPSRMKAEDR